MLPFPSESLHTNLSLLSLFLSKFVTNLAMKIVRSVIHYRRRSISTTTADLSAFVVYKFVSDRVGVLRSIKPLISRAMKSTRATENGGGYLVAAATMMTTNRKGEMSNGRANASIFFSNAVTATATRVFYLEDLLRALVEVLGKETGDIHGGVGGWDSDVNEEIEGCDHFREKIENMGAMDHGNLVPLRAYYFSRERDGFGL